MVRNTHEAHQVPSKEMLKKKGLAGKDGEDCVEVAHIPPQCVLVKHFLYFQELLLQLVRGRSGIFRVSNHVWRNKHDELSPSGRP